MQSWLSIKNKIIPSQKSKLIQIFNKIKKKFYAESSHAMAQFMQTKPLCFWSTNAIRIYVFWRIFCLDNFVKQAKDYFFKPHWFDEKIPKQNWTQIDSTETEVKYVNK